MKKVLMLMTILSFALKVAWAENTDVSQISNTIYIENFSVKVGEEKTVSVKMKNNFAPTGFQFDIVLPECISIKTEDDFYCIDLSTARTTSRKTDTFSSARRSDGSIRVICSSTNNYTFSGNDGEVASIVFKVNANAKPGDYTLTLKNVELSEANGTAHPLGFDVNSTITVTNSTESERNIIASGECGENATWTLDDEGLLTISGSGAMTNYSFVGNSRPWYYTKSSIKRIQVEDGITSIGDYTFYGCSSLTEITIPNSVTSIGDGAFYECPDLTDITIPNSVTSIGDFAFYGCSSLTDITIPNSVITIRRSAFSGCDGLANITIPNSVTSIENYAFLKCSGLTSIVVENGNKVYDSRDNCNAIIKTSTNTLIAGCQNTVIPNSVTSIVDNAFRDCSGLTEIAIPNSVTSIGDFAFYGCKKLASITNYSITPQEIASDTFSNYGTLHVVKGAGEVYANADYWKNFTIVEDATYATIIASGECGENATWTLNDEGLLTISGTGDMYNYDSWSPKAPWSEIRGAIKNVVIKEGINNVGSYSFYFCEKLESVELPNSVASINRWAFYGCNSLKTVEFLSSVTTLGDKCFYKCSGLSHVEIHSGLTSIGGGCFADCSSLQSINVSVSNPNYISIDGVLFTKDGKIMLGYPAGKNATSYSIPDGVEKLDYECFGGCINLQSIELPSSLNVLDWYCFDGCGSLSSIAIPNSVTYIGEECFSRCRSLKNIEIPSSVTHMGKFCFAGCWGLENVTISNGITLLDAGCFNNCRSLNNVKVPEGIVDIKGYTFTGCSSLKSIVLPSTLKTIGTEALAGCPLESVTSFASIPPAIDAAACNTDGTLHVLKGCGETYANADVWKNFTIVEDAVDPDKADTDISALDRAIYAENFEGLVGKQVKLQVKLKNDVEITSYQFELVLPEGVTVVVDPDDNESFLAEVSGTRTTAKKHNAFDCNYRKDGSFFVTCASTTNAVFSGSDGEVATITLQVADSMKTGNYPVCFRNVVLTEAGVYKSLYPEDVKLTMAIDDYIMGDANGDRSVNISDFSTIIGHLHDTLTDDSNVKAMDVNGDGTVNISDASTLISVLHNQ